MSPRKAPSDDTIYQLKITLKDAKPPIWRRVQVSSNITLAKLHKVIQAAMGWYDCHLHEFEVDGQIYGQPMSDLDDLDIKSDRTLRLNQFVIGEKFKFPYLYDMGDAWEHQILVERILPADPEARYPICIKGKRNCPPEDCGGVWGYGAFLEAIRDPQHPEHDLLLEWIGGDFDAEAFDLEATNSRLREIS